MRLSGKILVRLAILLCAILFVFPFLIILLNSVKPLSEIITTPLALPVEWSFENYVKSFITLDIPHVMFNTMLLTVLSIAGIVCFASMAAYWVVRHNSWLTRIFNTLMLMSMLVPFAAIMLPLIRFVRTLHLSNTLQGAILVYWGIGIALPYFMLQGSIKAIPYEIEEAAIIDGASPLQRFWRVVFPMMQPSIVTVIISDIFWIWNDFMVPLVMLNSNKFYTVQFAIKKLFGSYRGQWDLALPGLVMTVLPIIVVFILLQKKIISGIASGSVKA